MPLTEVHQAFPRKPLQLPQEFANNLRATPSPQELHSLSNLRTVAELELLPQRESPHKSWPVLHNTVYYTFYIS